MYTETNFKTKKALKEAIADGKNVYVYQPGPFGKPPADYTGEFAVEGPHYARVRVEAGRVVKVLG